MNNTERLARLGVHVPSIILPNDDVDLFEWAVIACDQHTSEPGYWKEVEAIVGQAPSTLHIVFPEVYLEEGDAEERIAAINATMRRYLDTGIVRELPAGMNLVVRSTPHVPERTGLLLALDLERYDFHPDAASIIRASERTIVERLPARVRIRQSAPMELPHILVLIDDPDNLVFGGIAETDPPWLYTTELMLGGGSVSGYHITDDALGPIAEALETLYQRAKGERPFLFAVGDGNHSLAAAKQVWDARKPDVADDHPARFALVEVVNLYDPGLRFEPIHRIVAADDPQQVIQELASTAAAEVKRLPVSSIRGALKEGEQAIGYIAGDEHGVLALGEREELPVTIVQEYLNSRPDLDVDYIHGWDTTIRLGQRPRHLGLLLPEFNPELLFPTIRRRGVLPRKAFSLGEAEEKRYYLEGRLIER